MTKVMLSNTLGILDALGQRTYVGPGIADVPDAYAVALRLTPLAEPKDYSALNADDFLALVASGELSQADALKLERSRDKPRKTVLEALEG